MTSARRRRTELCRRNARDARSDDAASTINNLFLIYKLNYTAVGYTFPNTNNRLYRFNRESIVMIR